MGLASERDGISLLRSLCLTRRRTTRISLRQSRGIRKCSHVSCMSSYSIKPLAILEFVLSKYGGEEEDVYSDLCVFHYAKWLGSQDMSAVHVSCDHQEF